MGRKFNFEKLKENYSLSELQLRQTIESTVLELFTVYYEVARLTQNKINQAETMDISKRRLRRARYSYEYGQSTQLDVLNAEVDFNNDSITYLNISQELDNTKRDLNVLLGREVNEAFSVDTSIVYQKGITLEILHEDALRNNVTVLQSESMLQNSKYDLNINKSRRVPKVYLNAGYNWDKTNFDRTASLQHRTMIGPVAGVNLSWNIFDGGYTKTHIQNSIIAVENQKISVEQTKQYLERNLNNAWGFYQNALFVLKAEGKNLDTSQRNFDRTLDQNKLGQITSIEFRQAQLNLLRAKLNFSKAKYQAKTAELALLKLSGELMFAQF
jgi:outer membrane protein TolC